MESLDPEIRTVITRAHDERNDDDDAVAWSYIAPPMTRWRRFVSDLLSLIWR